MAAKGTKFRHPDIDGVACVVALGMAVAGFWIGVRPALHSEDDSRRLGGQMDESGRQLDDVQGQYRQVRQQIRLAVAKLDAMAVVLDAPEQSVARQSEVSGVFQRAGISLEQLSVGTVERGELLDVIPLRLSGRGAFGDVVATMHTIREVFPDMAVSTFQIDASGGAGREDVGFSFNIAWYVGGEGEDQG
jgi:hypothetical protein